MQRDPRAFLWDVREAALAVQTFTAGMDVAAYAANEMAQSAVERKFEIIGEALNQLAKLDAALAARGEIRWRNKEIRGQGNKGPGSNYHQPELPPTPTKRKRGLARITLMGLTSYILYSFLRLYNKRYSHI